MDRRLLAQLPAFLLCLPAWATTWYVHSGNSAGGRDGTAANPYNSILEWHTAVNGGNFSTSGIIGTDNVLVLASSEGSYFREGAQTFNFGSDSTKAITIRAWDESIDGPAKNGTLRVQRPVLRNDILFTSLTNVSGTLYKSNALPSNVRTLAGGGTIRVLYKYDDPTTWTKEGFHAAVLTVTEQASDPASVPAGTAIYQTTTRQLWVDVGVTAVAADFSYCVTYTDDGVTGKTNAGLCLQNAYNCTIQGIDFYNYIEGSSGWYSASFDSLSVNNTIRGCRSFDSSHHGFGITASTAVVQTNNLIESCEVSGLGKNSGAAAFYIGTTGVQTGNRILNCTAHLYPTLKKDKTPVFTTSGCNAAWIGSSTSGVRTDVLIDSCRFNFYPSYLPLSGTYPSGPILTFVANAPSSVEDWATYPVRVVNCEFVNMTAATMDNNSAPTLIRQGVAYYNCVLDFSGFSNLTSPTPSSGVFTLYLRPSSIQNYLGIFSSIVSANLSNIGSSYPNIFSNINGGSSPTVWNVTVNDSLVSWTGGSMNSGVAYCGMYEMRSGTSGNTGMKIISRRSCYSNAWANHREASAGSWGNRELLVGDTGGATPNIDYTFQSCLYYNFLDGNYSGGTTYDDWSEWSVLVDPTGVKLTMTPVIGLPFRAIPNSGLPSTVKAALSRIPSTPGIQAPLPLRLRGRTR
jgi:hypothetical protein